MAAGVRYRERLNVPVRWWVLAALFVASVWVAYAVATPSRVAGLAAGVLSVGSGALLLGYGGVQVEVGPEGLRAGRALLPWWACGDVVPLDAEAFRRLGGPEADARAYLLLRPYLQRGVRVDVRDERDPTPYWLIATRHPDQLSDAVLAAVASARARGSE